eukprot:283337-Chlamydomonas_euryale.AAC.5
MASSMFNQCSLTPPPPHTHTHCPPPFQRRCTSHLSHKVVKDGLIDIAAAEVAVPGVASHDKTIALQRHDGHLRVAQRDGMAREEVANELCACCRGCCNVEQALGVQHVKHCVDVA